MFWTNYVLLCDSKHMSPNKVASKLGVRSSGTVTKWKSGETIPRDAMLMKIADFFEISVDDLLNTDLRAKEMPSLVKEEGRNKKPVLDIDGLSEDELRQVASFISGIKATHNIK